jgi:hypothetical protein
MFDYSNIVSYFSVSTRSWDPKQDFVLFEIKIDFDDPIGLYSQERVWHYFSNKYYF